MNDSIRILTNSIEFTLWKFEEDDANKKLLIKGRETESTNYQTKLEFTQNGLSGLNMNDITNVSLLNPSNNQILVYNSSSSKWENVNNTSTTINDSVNNSTTETWSNSKIQSEINNVSQNSIDYTSIQGSTQKINTETATSQSEYGVVNLYTAQTDLSTGQPVLFYYDSNGSVKVSSIGTLPDQHQIAGLCLNTVTAGGTAKVLVNGYGTARITPQTMSSSSSVSLNSITNGTVQSITNNTTFTDDGGATSNYSNGLNYSITFDAGTGFTIDMVVNSFSFEHTNIRMYDRLGIQGSNDGISYTNLSVPWMQTSNSSNPPYSQYFNGNNYWNDAGSNNGNILPENTTRAILLSSGTFPVTVNSGYRYLKFFFFSDSTANDAGWNITLQPNTPYSVGALPFTVGTKLYIDNNDYTKLSEDNTSQRSIGVVAYSDSSNNSVFCNINPALNL